MAARVDHVLVLREALVADVLSSGCFGLQLTFFHLGISRDAIA